MLILRSAKVVFCLLISLFITINVHAQTQRVITFEEFPMPSGIWPGDSALTENFFIENTHYNPNSNPPSWAPLEINDGTQCSPVCAYNGTNYILAIDGSMRITHSDSQLFAFESLDVAETHIGESEFWARQVDIVGELYGGGTIQTSFILDYINDGNTGSLVDFQTFVLPSSFTNLVALNITASGASSRDDFSVDNLTLSVLPQVIPEPISSSLFMVGGATFVLRSLFRRKKVLQKIEH